MLWGKNYKRLDASNERSTSKMNISQPATREREREIARSIWIEISRWKCKTYFSWYLFCSAITPSPLQINSATDEKKILKLSVENYYLSISYKSYNDLYSITSWFFQGCFHISRHTDVDWQFCYLFIKSFKGSVEGFHRKVKYRDYRFSRAFLWYLLLDFIDSTMKTIKRCYVSRFEGWIPFC